MTNTKKFSFKKFMLAVIGVIVAFCSIISILPLKTMSSVYAADEEYTDYTFVGGNFILPFSNLTPVEFSSSGAVFSAADSNTDSNLFYYSLSFDVKYVNGNFISSINLTSSAPLNPEDYEVAYECDLNFDLYNSARYCLCPCYMPYSQFSDYEVSYLPIFLDVDYTFVDSANFFKSGVYSFSSDHSSEPYSFNFNDSYCSDYTFLRINNIWNDYDADHYTEFDFDYSDSVYAVDSYDLYFIYYDDFGNSVKFTLHSVLDTVFWWFGDPNPNINNFPILESRSYYFKNTGNNYNAGYTAGYNQGNIDGKDVGYNQGYNVGQSAGYNSGYNVGQSAGYNQGYNAGNTAGQQTGYNAGYSDGVSSSQTDSYNQGYSSGYDAGNTAGYNAGNTAGYNNGYSAGATAGYQEGYYEGLSSDNPYTFNALFGSVLDAPVQTFTGLFNFDLLGVNLLSLFTGLLTLAIIIWVVKLALGGK